MTGTKHQAKKAAACQAKKPNEKGSHHQNGIRKHRWTKEQLFPLRLQLALPRLNGTDGAVHLQSDR
jgi:hypothetical protein